MGISKMLRCENGHLFEPRRYGRICPMCHMVVEGNMKSQAVAKVVDELEEILLFEEIELVCGWLACIDGPHRGQSFVLHTGKNFIGRADDMDIQIFGDSEIARRNHAVVAYDPKNRQFMLVPGESEGLVYLNGKSIFQATQLLDMGLIQIGETTLLFKPLCGDNFAWENNAVQENYMQTI